MLGDSERDIQSSRDLGACGCLTRTDVAPASFHKQFFLRGYCCARHTQQVRARAKTTLNLKTTAVIAFTSYSAVTDIDPI